MTRTQTGAIARRAAAVAVGLVADHALGEPPLGPAHPVAAFGSAMAGLEGWIYRDARWAGVVHTAAGVGLGTTAGVVVGSTAVAAAVATAQRALARAAADVGAALDAGDLGRARALLPCLAGREPEALDEQELARAVVESVAENTVDAVVAPAFWAVAGGAPGAFAYRAVNTLDAMVGHRSPRYRRYGWCSARLDDVAGWVPARLTAVLVAAVRPRSTLAIWRAVSRDAPRHPSVNAGVAEAAFAAALDLRLGGTNVYDGRVELRPSLGTGRPPEAADIARAVRLSGDVTLALVGTLLGVTLVARRRGPHETGRRP